MSTMINSQSTAAVNSAKTSFLLSATTMSPFFDYNKKEITELNKTDLVRFITNSICVGKTSTHFILEFGDERYCIYLNKDGRGYYVTVVETSSKTVQRPVKEIIRHNFDCFRLTEKNINNIATYVYDLVADYFYGVYDAETANTEAEISEAPVLDEAPSLEEDEITEDGYSVAGLEYVRENLWDVEVMPMLKESMGVLFNDPYTMENIMRGGVLDQEKFADALWDVVWEEHLCSLTDEALEAETRYYTDFDALCLQMCGAVAAYDEVMRVVENKADSDIYGAQGFSWDLFSEETMLTLFDNANLVEQIGDALFESVGCSDIRLYDDCLYLWYDNNSWETIIVTAA